MKSQGKLSAEVERADPDPTLGGPSRFPLVLPVLTVVFAVVGSLVLASPNMGSIRDMAPAVVAAAILFGGLVWAWIESVDRDTAHGGRFRSVRILLGVARAGLVVALVLVAMNPAVRDGMEGFVSRLAGRPATADGLAYQAALICASISDGSLRLTTWDQGCEAGEQSVPSGVGALPGGPAFLPTVEYRAGTVTIPAGRSSEVIAFSRSMLSAGYNVTVSVSKVGGPLTPDGDCRFLSVSEKAAEGFVVSLRLCHFEGQDMPEDRVSNDVTLDWIAIETR